MRLWRTQLPGRPLWTNLHSGPTGGNLVADLVVADRRGNVFVAGRSIGLENTDYLTLAYSNTGTPLWTNLYSNVYSSGPGNNEDRILGMALDHSGNVVVTGYSWNGLHYEYVTIKYGSSRTP